MMRTRVRDWLLRLCFALIRWLQDEPAQTLQPGDVVWCRMPLAQGQLENIPAAHQIRPYVRKMNRGSRHTHVPRILFLG